MKNEKQPRCATRIVGTGIALLLAALILPACSEKDPNAKDHAAAAILHGYWRHETKPMTMIYHPEGFFSQTVTLADGRKLVISGTWTLSTGTLYYRVTDSSIPAAVTPNEVSAESLRLVNKEELVYVSLESGESNRLIRP